jgi:hypothetical protein
MRRGAIAASIAYHFPQTFVRSCGLARCDGHVTLGRRAATARLACLWRVWRWLRPLPSPATTAGSAMLPSRTRFWSCSCVRCGRAQTHPPACPSASRTRVLLPREHVHAVPSRGGADWPASRNAHRHPAAGQVHGSHLELFLGDSRRRRRCVHLGRRRCVRGECPGGAVCRAHVRALRIARLGSAHRAVPCRVGDAVLTFDVAAGVWSLL